MDSFGNIGSEWNRRMSTNRLPWRGPGFPMYQPMHSPMMGLFRQPPPAHLSETMYVAERTGQKEEAWTSTEDLMKRTLNGLFIYMMGLMKLPPVVD